MKKLLLLFSLMTVTASFAQVTASDATLIQCEVNTDGFATFDLTQAENDVLNGQPAANFQVSYHVTNVDAQNGTNQLQPIYTNVVAFNETLYARVENIGSGNFATSLLFLEVVEGAIANPAQDLAACETGTPGFGVFDLRFNESIVLGNQNPADVDVSFYETQTDAVNGTNAIVNPSNYTNLNNTQTIYVRAENGNSNCYAITNFVLSTVDCTQDTDSDLVITSAEDVNNNGNLNDDDTDGNNVPNYLDDDDDGDGVLTADEDYNGNGDPTDDDTNANSIPDYLEESVALSTGSFQVIDFSVYPNPASHQITVQLTETAAVEKIQLYNLNGKMIKDFQLSGINQKNEFSISGISAGVYFLKIGNTQKTVVKKLVIK